MEPIQTSQPSLDTSQLVHLLVARLESFSKDLQEVKSSNKDMANAFSKLLLIEERQANTFAAQERLFKAQEKLDAKLEAYTAANREVAQIIERRVDSLEASAPLLKQVSTWVIAGVTGFIAFVAPKLMERLF